MTAGQQLCAALNWWAFLFISLQTCIWTTHRLLKLPYKIIWGIHEQSDELIVVLIPGPLSKPEQLLELMHQYWFAQGLWFDPNLDLNYLPQQINIAHLDYLTDDCYHVYPHNLCNVERTWHHPLPFSFPNLIILDIHFAEATYWPPAILQAVMLDLKRIILRDGDYIIDSAWV